MVSNRLQILHFVLLVVALFGLGLNVGLWIAKDKFNSMAALATECLNKQADIYKKLTAAYNEQTRAYNSEKEAWLRVGELDRQINQSLDNAEKAPVWHGDDGIVQSIPADSGKFCLSEKGRIKPCK